MRGKVFTRILGCVLGVLDNCARTLLRAVVIVQLGVAHSQEDKEDGERQNDPAQYLGISERYFIFRHG
jgi:hypothetical protein